MENGAAVADPPVADHPGEEEGEQPIPGIEVEGVGQQLTLDCGGAAANAASVKLKGGSIRIPVGEFKKGAIVNVSARLRCDEVHLVDKHDSKTGEVVEVERRHVFSIVWIERHD